MISRRRVGTTANCGYLLGTVLGAWLEPSKCRRPCELTGRTKFKSLINRYLNEEDPRFLGGCGEVDRGMIMGGNPCGRIANKFGFIS